jgi:hypothetical protein
MNYTIDTTDNQPINLEPVTVEEEVIQNLWFLYSSLEYDVPLDRALGLNATYIDKPIEAAKALATTDIYDKTEEYEPRAEIVSIDFNADYERGILKPIVEVEINGEYENEEYTE